MLKKIFKIIAAIISLVLLWFVCAWLLPKIKLRSESRKVKKTIDIYVKSNGMHTDIVMPRVNNCYNWSDFIDQASFHDIDTTYHYVSIGWGDKGFYLNTPTFADLKCKTLLSALFGLGSSAMHVTYYKHMEKGDLIKKISISESDYLNLISQIIQSFNLKDQKPQLIPHPSYGKHDNYFEANGTYGIFKTCNVWTGNTLKEANISMGLWTPLEFGVMDNL